MAQDIQEFLIALGYKIKADQERRFLGSLEKTNKAVLRLAEGMAAAAIATLTTVDRMSDGLERLYYQAQRTGTAVQAMKEAGYASEQLGSSADAARGSIEALAASERKSPGLKLLAESLIGVAGAKNWDPDKQAQALAEKFKSAPIWKQLQIAQLFSIPETEWRARQDPYYYKKKAEEAEKIKASGGDPEAAALAAKRVAQARRSLMASIDAAGTKLVQNLGGPLADFLDRITKWLDAHSIQVTNALTTLANGFLDLATDIGTALPKFEPLIHWIDELVKGTIGWRLANEALAAVIVGRLAMSMLSLVTGIRMFSGIALLPGFAALLSWLGIGVAVGATGAAMNALMPQHPEALTGEHHGAGHEYEAAGGHGSGRGQDERNRAGGGPLSGQAGADNTSLQERRMHYMDRLITVHGWTPEGAASAAGEAEQESGFSPGSYNVGEAAVGIHQWRFDRNAAVRAYVKEAAGRGVSSVDAQIDFMNEERKHRGKSQANWHAVTSIEEGNKIGYQYEQYGDFSGGTRRANARRALEQWNAAHPAEPAKPRVEGGPVSPNKPYVVGEAGPELFVPGSHGAIVPNVNLGNIRAKGGGFRHFASEDEAAQAIVETVKKYKQRFNADTIPEIMHHYSPPNENKTAYLIKKALKRTGFGKAEHLDFANPDVASRFAYAIAVQEGKAREGTLSKFQNIFNANRLSPTPTMMNTSLHDYQVPEHFGNAAPVLNQDTHITVHGSPPAKSGKGDSRWGIDSLRNSFLPVR